MSGTLCPKLSQQFTKRQHDTIMLGKQHLATFIFRLYHCLAYHSVIVPNVGQGVNS